MEGSATGKRQGVLGRAVDMACEQPGKVLAWVLGIHFVVWTILPILVCPNLQLDLAEGLAVGREWQLGYWKHPPLPWWIDEIVYRATGQMDAVYVLGPLASIACLYFVWRLGRETLGGLPALIAVLSLEGLHFLNFSAVKFAHDQMQLPFWALSGLFFYRALKNRKPFDWIAAGAFVALAFWSKYAAFTLGATFALILLFDPDARTAWRSSGPYLMGATFLIVLAPNLWWLATHDFLPFQYLDVRAAKARHWWDYPWFPLRWTASQLFFLAPTLAVLAIIYDPARVFGRTPVRRAGVPAFERRYLTALALGPFLITTIVGAVSGRLPVAMWGYPLWIFAPLGLMAWITPHLERPWLRHFAVAFAIVFVAMPISYAVVEVLEPVVNDRVKATHFPGRLMADAITRNWHDKTGMPLAYVGGIPRGFGPGEFAANNLAVYSPDRPRVIVHGLLRLSPWIDQADLERRGAVFVWESTRDVPELRAMFPGLELQPVLTLPRQGPFSTTDVVVNYAFLLPKRQAKKPGIINADRGCAVARPHEHCLWGPRISRGPEGRTRGT